jgi:hypothetical protein
MTQSEAIMKVWFGWLSTRRRHWLAVVVVVAISWLATTSIGRANLWRPEALDVTLLRADAILVATIDGIRQAGTARYRVALADPAVVTNRWESTPSGFELRGELMMPVERTALGRESSGVESIRALPYGTFLQRGHRYLFLLSGGRHPSAPSDAATPFYEVDPEGHVLCGSGFVFGLSPMGLNCARTSDVAGQPPIESELRAQLAAAVEHARRRRPDLAAECDASLEALESPGSDAP